jgi:triacylglycerol lipase
VLAWAGTGPERGAVTGAGAPDADGLPGWLRSRTRRQKTLAAVTALIVAVLAVIVAVDVIQSGPGPSAQAGVPGPAGPGGAGAGAGQGGGSPAPSASSPAGGKSSGGTAARPSQKRLGPVLLVPGYGNDAGDLTLLAGQIRAVGRPVQIVSLPDNGTGDLAASARVLNAAVSKALRGGAPSVDVIGYSAGGVITLIWAQKYDGAARARRVITLGSPFHGTTIAAAAKTFVPGACPLACRQLAPDSGLLAGLHVAANPVPRGLLWLSLWSSNDVVVTPPTSAQLPGAVNAPVQSVCPSLTVSHLQLPSNPEVTAMVLGALGRTPLRRPTASACHS